MALISDIKKLIKKRKVKKYNNKRMGEYLNTIKTNKLFKKPFKKTFGVAKHGDIVHKIEVNGMEIKTRDFILLKEEK